MQEVRQVSGWITFPAGVRHLELHKRCRGLAFQPSCTRAQENRFMHAEMTPGTRSTALPSCGLHEARNLL